MAWSVFMAAMASSAFHAGWNAIAKKQPCPSDAICGLIIGSATLCATLLPFVGLPPQDAWIWIGSSTICNVLYSRTLMAAYDRTNFALAYPIMRSMIPPALLMFGWIVLDEPPTLSNCLGLIIVVTSLFGLSMTTAQIVSRDYLGMVLAGVAGTVLAFGLTLDTYGIRLGERGLLDCIRYGVASSLATATALTIVCMLEQRRSPFSILRQNFAVCYLGAGLLLTSALAALWAYAQGPVAFVASVREGGILFGGLFAVTLLRERVSGCQWLAMVGATIGVVLVKVG